MTNTIAFQSKGAIKMIAHRGLSGLERENTCPAFVAAGVKSYYGIESDVHVTRDGKYIIVHDDDLKRIANLNMSVEGSTFDELRAVRLKDTDEVSERADLFLPTLGEYLAICKKYEKVAVLELKNHMEEEHVLAIAETVKAYGYLEHTVFISCAGENLVVLKKQYPSACAQFLSGDTSEDAVRFMVENDLEADYHYKSVTKEFVDTMHAHGKRVNVWIVNTLEDAEKMEEFGVDMITTNILE